MVFLALPLIAEPRQPIPEHDSFRWRPALLQSGLFTLLEQGGRLAQRGTRDNLKGPFFKDYWKSVQGLSGRWDDGDTKICNYMAHPMQGAVAGYIQVQNDPKGMYLEFSRRPEYWKSRLKGLAWSAAYSTQFELGPLGEAAIGNIGMIPGTMAMVDLIMTPAGGLGWQMGEDAVDRYVIRWIESRTDLRGVKLIARSMLNPCRSLANLLHFRYPWHRDTRNGINWPLRRRGPSGGSAPPAGY